ncbi:MAG: hypothetical protein IT234_04630 [Bacteroidia bacterium]|nr:hypothetical protein [Bacteroidia bacterium]
MEQIKSAIQDPDTGKWEVDGKEFSPPELEAIIALYPQIKWIMISWANPKKQLNINDNGNSN